jgi:FAD synthetase
MKTVLALRQDQFSPKDNHMKRILIFGTFDGLHPGHLDFLKQAKKQGGYLIAVAALDATVKAVKGRFPKLNERERLDALKKSGLVDQAVLGGDGDPYQIIRQIKPDIICLGYDQEAFTDELPEALKNAGLDITIIRLKPYQPERYHSAILNL